MDFYREGKILALISTPKISGDLEPYAKILSRMCDKQLQVIQGQGEGRFSKYFSWILKGKMGLDQICQNIMKYQRPCMLIMDWRNDCGEQTKSIFKRAALQNIPIVAIKKNPGEIIRRIFIPINDEDQSIHQLSIACEFANALKVPIKIIRILDPTSAKNAPDQKYLETLRNLIALQLKMTGISAPVDVMNAIDALALIENESQIGDLIICGAPNSLRYLENFDETIPALAAAKTTRSLLMYMPPKIPVLKLRDIFEGNICIGKMPANRLEAITMLMDMLITRQVIPFQWKEMILEKYKKQYDNNVESESGDSLFLNFNLPGLCRLLGCMGIFQNGIGSKTQPLQIMLVFLTPDNLCCEYLTSLSKLSSLLIMPKIQEEIRKAKMPMDVLNILDLDTL